MPNFTNEDYLNLILLHGECNKVVDRTIRLFIERFPDRPRPTRDTINRTMTNLRNVGSFVKKTIHREKSVVEDENNEITVLAYFCVNPQNSLKDAEIDLGLSQSSVWRILKKHKMHPYKFNRVQHLKETDFVRRTEFCEAMMIRFQENENFLDCIIWTDESKFTKNGSFNRHNSHYWDEENNHHFRQWNFQETWSFNVFCAIKNNAILDVHIYDETLTGKIEHYTCLHYLKNVLP